MKHKFSFETSVCNCLNSVVLSGRSKDGLECQYLLSLVTSGTLQEGQHSGVRHKQQPVINFGMIKHHNINAWNYSLLLRHLAVSVSTTVVSFLTQFYLYSSLHIFTLEYVLRIAFR
jgi:hypothetical protein